MTSHAYGTPGTYVVTLTVVDNETLTDTATGSVIIDVPPLASFTMNPSPANPGVTVTFDGSGSLGNITDYDWDFGDGNLASGVVVTHAYAAPGTYTVRLVVRDNASLTDTETQFLRVNAPPIASFVADPPQTVMGVAVTFNASTSSDPDGTVASFAWTFGDGDSGTGILVTHTYREKGVFAVTLIVTDGDGVAAQATRSVLVANRRPTITATDPANRSVVLPAGGSASLSVNATDPDLDALAYTWRIDGDIVLGADRDHLTVAGDAPGAYAVNVTVSDGELQDWWEWTVTVEPSPTGPASGLPWIAGAVVVAVVLASLFFLLWRRRKRGSGE